MSFGLTFDKLLLIGIIAVFLLGPDRLPHYASRLAHLVKSVRTWSTGAKDRLRDQVGPEFDEIEWTKFDPRRYDPRQIIRDALTDDNNRESAVRLPQVASSMPRDEQSPMPAPTETPAT